MTTTDRAAWALGVASAALEHELPARWVHVQAAIAKARAFAPAVPGEEDVLVAAVALHDVGFAPVARDTGFSTLDAAHYLQGLGAESRLVNLVAHQCAGSVEAQTRGFAEHYDAFGPDEATAVRDAMWTACLTTGPDGADVTVAQRCDEWLVRYDFEWLRSYLELTRGLLEAAEQRTRERLEVSIPAREGDGQ